MTDARHEIYVSWDEIQNLCTQLAEAIIARGLRHGKILAITRAGLFPAGLLARELNIKLVETIGVATYENNEAGIGSAGVAKLIKEPAPEFLDNTLIVDDLVDTGTTMEFLRARSKNCTFVTIFAKPDGEKQVDIYAQKAPQDTWIRFPWDTRRQFVTPLVK